MRALAFVALAAPFVAGCFHPAPPPDVGAARAYDRFPLYWVGEEFEGWRSSMSTRGPSRTS